MNLIKKLTIIVFTIFYIAWSQIVLASDIINSENIDYLERDQPILEKIGPDDNLGPISSTGNSDEDTLDNVEAVSKENAINIVEPLSNNQRNSDTGSNSINTNFTDSGDESEIKIDNDSDIGNTANADLVSGNNNVLKNTTVEGVKSGDLSGSLNFINASGSNFAEGSSVGISTIDGSKTSQIIIPTEGILKRTLIPNSTNSNMATGARSQNNNITDSGNSVSFITNDNSYKLNNLIIQADSGNNNIAKNSLVGDVITGDINLGANIINLKNFVDPTVLLAIDIWSIRNGLNGDIVLPSNSYTGAGSINNNLVNSHNNTALKINDSSDIENVFDFQTNTGNNSLLGNTSIGQITTGKSNVTGQIINQTTPVFYLINVFGKFTGKVIGIDGQNYLINEIANNTMQAESTNLLTGTSSENKNIILNNQDKEVIITDSSTVSNKIKVIANTGKNNISENTLINNVKTGSINIIANAINLAGDVVSALGLNNVKLRVINIFGDWNGNLIYSNQEKSESLNIPAILSDVSLQSDTGVDNNAVQNRVLGREYLNIENGIPSVLSGELPNAGTGPVELNGKQDNQRNNNPLGLIIVPSIILAISISLEMLLRLRKK